MDTITVPPGLEVESVIKTLVTCMLTVRRAVTDVQEEEEEQVGYRYYIVHQINTFIIITPIPAWSNTNGVIGHLPTLFSCYYY